jgi:hypothetical protein
MVGGRTLWVLVVAGAVGCGGSSSMDAGSSAGGSAGGNSGGASAGGRAGGTAGGTAGGSSGGTSGGSAGGASGGAAGGMACVPSCQMKICGDDGCGGSCGTCNANEACTNGRCVTQCAPEADVAFCQRLGKNCGAVTGNDNCGQSRTAMCGACASPQTCQADNLCRCIPESDAAFCTRLGKNCGLLSAPDSCGLPRTAMCGSCTAPQSCNGAGVPNVCGCSPQCQGKVCGDDGCGGTCGACPANSTCAADRASCSCNMNFLPTADLSGCAAVGLSCASSEPREFCVGGRFWVVCDPQWGRQAFDCGAGQCQPNGRAAGTGSCTCGTPSSTFPALSSSGSCAPTGWSTITREHWFVCAPNNRTFLENCRAYTGQQTGRCWSYVTSFGFQTGCYCDTCLDYNTSTRQCVNACLFGSCFPAASTGSFICQ